MNIISKLWNRWTERERLEPFEYQSILKKTIDHIETPKGEFVNLFKVNGVTYPTKPPPPDPPYTKGQ